MYDHALYPDRENVMARCNKSTSMTAFRLLDQAFHDN
jgi:hypothetical protein